MSKEYDAIVIGLGGIGSGALYWLSRTLGNRVLGIEQFELGHVHGGSHDHSRIIRLSYHSPEYVRLAKRSYAAWSTVEADNQAPLIVKTGGLDLSPSNSAIPIETYSESMDAENVPYEWLDASEVMRRWPQFRLTDDVRTLYQAESGIAPAAKCVAAHHRLAQQHGATILEQTEVKSIREIHGEVEVVVNNVDQQSEVYRCHKVVIAAGAWSNHHLAHFGIRLPLTVTKEQVVYFDSPHARDYAPERFPIWIWMDEPCYYGFPLYGESGPKVAQDAGGKETSVETRDYEQDPDAFRRVDEFVRQVLPTAHGQPLYTKTCLYTMPPDRDFIVDFLPDSKNVAVAIGAGHAFKFASVLGQILSELVTDGQTPSDISGFGFDRPILWEENPETSFMV